MAGFVTMVMEKIQAFKTVDKKVVLKKNNKKAISFIFSK